MMDTSNAPGAIDVGPNAWAMVYGVDVAGEAPAVDFGPVWTDVYASNYGTLEPERFDTLGDAVAEIMDRDGSYRFPCWTDGLSARFYGVDPREPREDGEAYAFAELTVDYDHEVHEDRWTLGMC